MKVWGCVTWWGVGRLHRIDGRLTGVKYCSILEESLIGTIKDHNISPGSFVLVQDNDPKHTSKVATKWLTTHHIHVLPWPSSSPDMNIIEHVWAFLERRIRRRKPLPSNLEELWVALQEEWGQIGVDFIRQLYRSIPQRILALKAAHGVHTKY